MSNDYNYQINIVLFGDKNTGKTTLFNRFRSKPFYYNYRPTCGIVYANDILEVEGRRFKVNLWDVGTTNYTLFKNYIDSSNVIIFVCNLNENRSQLFIVDTIQRYSNANKKIYILGNIRKGQPISICKELTNALYNFNILIVTIDLLNNCSEVLRFYNDIITSNYEASNFSKIGIKM